MSFIVRHHGTILQQALGPNTETTAARITAFDPGAGWREVE